MAETKYLVISVSLSKISKVPVFMTRVFEKLEDSVIVMVGSFLLVYWHESDIVILDFGITNHA